MSIATQEYVLRYEGPADASENTLRHIKGVFVADLEFPIADVQHFLSSAPIIILQTQHESTLQRAFDLLRVAGAKVSIQRAPRPEVPLPKDLASPEEGQLLAVKQNEVSSDTVEVLNLDPEETASLTSMQVATLPSGNTEGLAVVNETAISFNEPTSEPLTFTTETCHPEVLLDDTPEITLDSFTDHATGETVNPDTQLSGTAMPEPSKKIEALATVEGLEFSLDTADVKDEVAAAPQAGLAPVMASEMQLSFETEEPEQGDPPAQQAIPVTAGAIEFNQAEASTNRSNAVHAMVPPTKAAEATVVLPTVAKVATTQVSAEISALDRLAPLPPQRKIGSKDKLNLRSAATAIVIAGLFVALNIFYLLPALEKTTPQQTFDLQQIFNQEKQSKPLSAALPVDRFSFTIDHVFNTYRVTAETNAFIDVPARISFSIIPSDPPPLTKEEIVAGKAPPDWIRRIELKDVSLFVDAEQKLQGAAFLQLNGQPVRVAAPLTLHTTISQDKSVLIVHIASDSPNTQSTGNENGVKLSKDPNGLPAINLRIDLSLKKILVN